MTGKLANTATAGGAAIESDAIEQFCDAMFNQDIRVNPADIIADGRLHRIHADGDGKNVRDAFYVLHIDDRPAGKFGHNGKYGYDVSFPWSMKVERAPMSAEEKRAWREKMDADRARREAEEVARHAAAAELANRIWDAAAPITGDGHPYLARKGVQSYGLRVGRWEKIDPQTGEVSLISDNALLVPIWAPGKKIFSLQAILPDAKKLGRDKDYLSGANKHGHYFSIGKPLEHEGKAVILIAEGYATGATLHAETGHAVIVAFDAPNLLPVAELMRSNYPDATIIVCADNDQWTLKPVKNPGLTRANEVRDAVGALVALPVFDESLGVEYAPGKRKGPSDFNDLANLEGADSVRRVIADTLNPPVFVEPSAPTDVLEAAPIPPWEDIPNADGGAVLDAPAGDDMAGVMFFQSQAPAAAADELDRPTDNPYFRCLGYKDKTRFLFSSKQKQVVEFVAKDISENFLLDQAPLNWWELHFSNGKEGGINKRAAANFLLQDCIDAGIYDNNRRRGRGAWIDEGRTVFHHGGRLSVDGETVELENIKSRFAYVIDDAWPEPAADQLSDEEGARLLGIATSFRWKMPGSAALLAGWTALAPLCGAIAWRPHIWLTGGAGSGKSTILNEYIFPLMSGTSIFSNGNSTEAGLRQKLKSDARPVLFDESESNEEGDIRRIQNVLSLIRQASTESAARTYKGTAGGDVMEFHIRSMFALASIQVALKNQADIERMTVLGLHSKRTDAGAADEWNALKEELYSIKRDPTIAARLMRRSLNMLPVIQQNIEVFKEAAARYFKSQRDGDQFGTLMAGCWSLVCRDLATPEQATAMIEEFDWSEHRETDGTSNDAQKIISTLFGQQVRLEHGEMVTLNSLVRVASGLKDEDDDVTLPAVLRETKKAQRALMVYGLRVDDGYVSVANNQIPPRDKLLEGTFLATDLRGALRRLPGHDNNGNDAKKFGAAHKASKVIRIPLSLVIAEEEVQEGEF